MKISMWMLYDAIADSVDRHNLSEAAEARHLNGIHPFLQGEPLSGDHVYLIQASALEKANTTENSCLVICGNGTEINPECGCQFIRLRPELSAGMALKLMLNAFEKYNAWYDKLRQALVGNPNLTRICEIGNELLENYLTLFNPEHILIAYASLPENMIGSVLEKKNGPYYVLTDKAYKAMVSSPEHQDDTRAEHAAFFFDPVRQLRVLYANIGPGRFECRLCIGEEKRPFKRSDAQLCEILADVLLTAFQQEHSIGMGNKTNLRDLLQSLIKEQSVEGPTLDQNLKAWQWKRHDRFICMELEKMNPGSKFVSNDHYICSRIEELLQDACSFMLDGKIICLVRLLNGESPKLSVDKLTGFLTDSIFMVGVSDEFSDIMDIGNYYKEATIAVQLGRTRRPADWRHMFADYALLHLFQNGTSVLPAVYFCNASVRKLLDYRDTKVDYCETLRVYLENDRNLLRAAEVLHIHRTTLFYRLNRIGKMIDADLDDPGQRLHILFSFEMLELDKNPDRFTGGHRL